MNMDGEVHPELINSRVASVSVPRASHDAQIHTNNPATLTESLSRDVPTASAIDFGKSRTLIPRIGLSQALAKATALQGLA